MKTTSEVTARLVTVLPSSHERDVLLAAAHRFLRGDRLATELNVLAIVGLTGLESTAQDSC